jgi:phenylpropionate dioxygenase-like ring-hydroxylating dioxygenase large terminal subunit
VRLSNVDPALEACWQVVCRSDEVTAQPTAFSLLGRHWVLWRDANGTVVAFLDQCPHRLAPLSLGTCNGDAVLRCSYHGWQFDASGTCIDIPALGEYVHIPSRARLTAPHAIAESHGLVFMAVLPPRTPLPTVIVASDPRFQRGDLPATTTTGAAGLFADNFLDVAHFPFVHAATFGAGEEHEVPAYTLERDGYTFTASYEHLFANREDPGVAAGLRPLIQRRALTYRYTAPFHMELEINYLDAGGTNVIGFFISPADADTVRIYSTLWRNDLGGSTEAMDDAVAFEVAVLEEDLIVQNAYRDRSLPLDPTIEIHTKADRTTVELRRILSDLVAGR